MSKTTQTLFVSPLMVCQSAAGYYVGHLYADTEMGMLPDEFALPWSRESYYFESEERAKLFLEQIK